MLDKLGRPTTKTCPDCKAELSRPTKQCPKCFHVFLNRTEQREAGIPRQRPVVIPEAPPVAVIDPPSVPADFEFDCIALDDGRLRLVLPGGDLILSREQRGIVAIELRRDMK